MLLDEQAYLRRRLVWNARLAKCFWMPSLRSEIDSMQPCKLISATIRVGVLQCLGITKRIKKGCTFALSIITIKKRHEYEKAIINVCPYNGTDRKC